MSQVGTIYGNALYDLCKEEQLQERVLSQLQMLSVSFEENPAFLQLLCAPNIPVQERCQVVDDCFRGKVEPYVLNFLKLLTEKMQAKQFLSCVAVFQNLYNEENGILPVTAVTATPLTQEQSARLTEKLSQITGKTAVLSNRVDPECLGGVTLDYDGKRVDGSVAGRLENIRNLLKNTVL